MTFSIAGRCARSGMFGVAITTSSIAVGARCPHVRAGVGAVSTQNVTDPALGPLLLDYLEDGLNAREAITAVTRNRKDVDYRQLLVVDQFGQSASYSGERILGINAVSEDRNCVAAGNLLKFATIPGAMTESFLGHTELHLAERLLQSLEAGAGAGGEEGPVHSAALLVCHEHSFPLVSLRVDWHDSNPIGALRSLWTNYEPQMEVYLQRAINPSAAPSFGVPGDEK